MNTKDDRIIEMQPPDTQEQLIEKEITEALSHGLDPRVERFVLACSGLFPSPVVYSALRRVIGTTQTKSTTKKSSPPGRSSRKMKSKRLA